MASRQPSNQPAAESSNAAEIRAQTEDHPFLQFQDPVVSMRYQFLKEMNIKTTSSIDWEQIQTIDPYNRLASLLPVDTPWRRFFDILEPTYDELVYEFWSTFNFAYPINLTKPSIRFRLGGQQLQMSLTEFALRLGIYSADEVNSSTFTKALTDLPVHINDYWNIYSTKLWGANNYSTSYRDPLYQYMHLVIANTVRERTTNLQRVSATDLFLLYSIFESVPCNIAYFLAMNFEQYKRSRIPKNLFGGSYITRLAKSLDILTDPVIQGLSPPRKPGYVGFEDIKITLDFSRPRVTSLFLRNTIPQNLQQELMQFPPSSFYRHDLRPQLPSEIEHVPINPPQTHPDQPQTPSLFLSLSPLLSEQGMLPPSFFDEDMIIQGTTMTELPLSPLWQRQAPPQLSDYQEQPQPPNEEAGPSTVPPVNPSLDQIRIDSARAVEQVRRMSLQIEWLKQRDRWHEEMLRWIADIISIQITSPPPPIKIDSGSEPDPDSDKD